MIERRVNAARRQHFDRAWRDLQRRLRRVYASLDEGELAQLSARMTRLRLKYESLFDLRCDPRRAQQQ